MRVRYSLDCIVLETGSKCLEREEVTHVLLNCRQPTIHGMYQSLEAVAYLLSHPKLPLSQSVLGLAHRSAPTSISYYPHTTLEESTYPRPPTSPSGPNDPPRDGESSYSYTFSYHSNMSVGFGA